MTADMSPAAASGGTDAPALRLLIVGDAHGHWDESDRAYAEGAGADAVVFVGDLGDEDVALVERVAALRCTKLVVPGNHDAWHSFRRGATAAFHRQVDVLGQDFLGFRSRALHGGRFALVGARPWSWGGGYKRVKPFYAAVYGIEDEAASVRRIVAAAESHPGATLVLVGHNGPTGLGEGRDAIFGRDFLAPHVDFGDPDFGEALRRLRAAGRRIPLVAAGHMHEALKGGGLRRRIVVADGTTHVNAAVVPRHRRIRNGTLRHFVEALVTEYAPPAVADLWVDDAGAVAERIPLIENQGA